jgi:hypothetical protein
VMTVPVDPCLHAPYNHPSGTPDKGYPPVPIISPFLHPQAISHLDSGSGIDRDTRSRTSSSTGKSRDGLGTLNNEHHKCEESENGGERDSDMSEGDLHRTHPCHERL